MVCSVSAVSLEGLVGPDVVALVYHEVASLFGAPGSLVGKAVFVTSGRSR